MTDTEVGNITTESPRGATVETYGVRRRVKVFGILDHEMETLSSLNAQATVFFSVAASLASSAYTISISAGFAEKLTSSGELLNRVAQPALYGLGVVFACLGLWAWRKRTSTMARIRKESEAS